MAALRADSVRDWSRLEVVEVVESSREGCCWKINKH